jgi:uncharacterized protein YggE
VNELSRVLLIGVAIGLGQPSLGAAAQAPSSAPTVIAEGEAIVRRAADRAWLTMATETREARASDARSRGAEAMSSLQRALRDAGVPADAIRTTAYALVPEMSWNNGRGTVRGYLVRNQIEVRVDDLDELSDVIEAANSARNTSVSVTGPRFDLKDRAGAEAEALRQAVSVAMSRAQAIAAGAKRSLGSIVRIEEQGGSMNVPEPVMMRAMAADAQSVPTPITPGDIEVRGAVRLTAELR